MFLYSISRHIDEGQTVQIYNFNRNVWKSHIMTNDCLTTDKEEAELTFDGILAEGWDDSEIRLNVYKAEYDHVKVFRPKKTGD